MANKISTRYGDHFYSEDEEQIDLTTEVNPCTTSNENQNLTVLTEQQIELTAFEEQQIELTTKVKPTTTSYEIESTKLSDTPATKTKSPWVNVLYLPFSSSKGELYIEKQRITPIYKDETNSFKYYPEKIIAGHFIYPYQNFSQRLRSFHLWPDQHKQKGKELARAGFYYSGTADLCYCCASNCGGLRNWLPEENPLEEHRKKYPNCAFVRLVTEII